MTKKTTTADELITELARVIVEMTKAKTLQSLQTSIEYRSNALTKEKEAHAKTKRALSETEAELAEARLTWKKDSRKTQRHFEDLSNEMQRLNQQIDELRSKLAQYEANEIVNT